jgi:hypothetical protein
MNWESWFCSNQACTGGAWMVQRDPATSDVWWVAAHGEKPSHFQHHGLGSASGSGTGVSV